MIVLVDANSHVGDQRWNGLGRWVSFLRRAPSRRYYRWNASTVSINGEDTTASRIETDASDFTIGGILSQLFGEEREAR